MNNLSKLIETRIAELIETRIAEEGYADIDGTPCTLERLVRDEPDWACSVIRHYKKKMLGKEAEVEQLKKQINQLIHNQRRARETEHTPIPVYTVDSFLKTYCGHCGNPADCCVCIIPDRDKFKTITGALHPCGG